jgi:plasmid stability protein
MGMLTVRNVDDEVIRALRIRAAKNGRSAEAEHRVILRQALMPDMAEVAELLRRRRESLAGRDFADTDEIIRRMRDERAGR